MNTTTLMLLLLFCLTSTVVVLQVLTYLTWRDVAKFLSRPVVPPQGEAPPADLFEEPETGPLQAVPRRSALPPFPAPMVGDQTLKQYMIHLYNSDGVFLRFTDHFYAYALTSHHVRPLFEGKDTQEIKRKFHATLLIMFDKGVDERAAATLVKLHAHLNMSEEAYDATMDALERTLVEYKVPEKTILQLVPMIEYFRDEMVADR